MLVFLLISQACNLVVLNHTLSNTVLAAQKQIEETNQSQSNLFEINLQEKGSVDTNTPSKKQVQILNTLL